MVPILRLQTELLATAKLLTDDTANNRWSDARLYAAMNLAIATWQGRVQVPYLYTVSGGWLDSTYDFSLPAFIDGPLTPQALVYSGEWPLVAPLDSADSTWQDIQAYSLEQNATGGQTLRLQYLSNTGDGRILWWGHNGPVPASIPATSATIDADDTSLTLTTKPVIGRSGYIKVEAEWMQYAGVTEGATTLTLTNLVRGLNGTTAAGHNAPSGVTWGIALDRSELENQLLDQLRMHAMQYYLMNTSSHEVEQYKTLLVFYRDQARDFWKSYTSARTGKPRLGKMAIGERSNYGLASY